MYLRLAPFGLGVFVGCSGVVCYLKLSLSNVRTKPESLHTEDLNSNAKITTTPDLISTYTFKYGRPELPVSFHLYKEHSLVYDHSRKIPSWTADTITSKGVSSNIANRKKSTFRPDPAIPPNFSSANDDYRNSGWSRGHMVPAGNKKYSQEAMDDTFYLTNIVPQDLDNNCGYWNRLETYCRDLTKRYAQVHVISGPLFLPEVDQDSGKNFIKYEVLGKNRVAVPTHLFKVILAEGEDEDSALGVFIIPNVPIGNIDLTYFQVSLEELESYAGCIFHPKLDREKVIDLCTADSCRLISSEKMALIIFTRRLNSAKNIENLERIWDEMDKKNIKPDSLAKDAYQKRKAKLKNYQDTNIV